MSEPVEKIIPKLLRYENIPPRWLSHFLQNFINNAGSKNVMIRYIRIIDEHVAKPKTIEATLFGTEKNCNNLSEITEHLYKYIKR